MNLAGSSTFSLFSIWATNVGKLCFGETANYIKKNYISIRYNFVSVGSLLNLFVYAQVRLRHKNKQLARVKKTLCFGLQILSLSATNMAAGFSQFCCLKYGWKLSRGLLTNIQKSHLTNVGMQTGTAVTGLAAFLPRTPPPSPPPPDMKVG